MIAMTTKSSIRVNALRPLSWAGFDFPGTGEGNMLALYKGCPEWQRENLSVSKGRLAEVPFAKHCGFPPGHSRAQSIPPANGFPARQVPSASPGQRRLSPATNSRHQDGSRDSGRIVRRDK